MNLTEQLQRQIDDPTLTRAERIELRCQLARRLQDSGEYEAACEMLGEFWPGLGVRPRTDGLDLKTTAEVLLRTGALNGFVGSLRQAASAQEFAKNLLSESAALFETLQARDRAAEAHTELAYCYWREGALGEARVVLQETLTRLAADNNDELRAAALLRLAIVESSATRYSDALRLLTEAAPLFAASSNDAKRGTFHMELAVVLKFLSAGEHRDDYADRALVEYAAASFHFEQSGHTRYLARVENNLGYLHLEAHRFATAHEHLDRARRLFARLKDAGSVAQVDETRARVLLAEGRYAEAAHVVRNAVTALERGGEQLLLAEALTTEGTALARLGQHEAAHATLVRAVEVAERAGDLEGAGRAELTILEELVEYLTLHEQRALYESADQLLARSQDPNLLLRLRASARRVIEAERTHDEQARLVYVVEQNTEGDDPWAGFSLKEEVQRFEEHLIEQALKDAQGRVSHAARLLGFKHHETLNWRLKNRNKSLADARKPVRPRRRSIIRNYERKRA